MIEIGQYYRGFGAAHPWSVRVVGLSDDGRWVHVVDGRTGQWPRPISTREFYETALTDRGKVRNRGWVLE